MIFSTIADIYAVMDCLVTEAKENKYYKISSQLNDLNSRLENLVDYDEVRKHLNMGYIYELQNEIKISLFELQKNKTPTKLKYVVVEPQLKKQVVESNED